MDKQKWKETIIRAVLLYGTIIGAAVFGMLGLVLVLICAFDKQSGFLPIVLLAACAVCIIVACAAHDYGYRYGLYRIKEDSDDE